jgi:radical SAM superfamily enzyme YgiQ (UPF0313 family)
MRVLLIYPHITLRERYSSDIGYSGGRQLPLGVFYLASAARESGHDVGVIDAEANGMTVSDVGAEVVGFCPDVVGISTTTVAFGRALETAREVKTRLPSIPVVFGGPHVTNAVETVVCRPEVDFAVLGEGEITLLDLLNTLNRGGGFDSIPGLAFLKNGSVILNPPRPFIQDLDRVPFPAYDLVPDFSLYNPPPTNYRELPVANIITSRGCPNKCTFCGHSAFGRVLRQRSPRNIASEIELLYKRYHIREIAFVDDTFTINPDRILTLFRILDEKGIRLPWTCMSRINTVNLDILKFMKAHGCWHISLGIESGNPHILRLIRKNISLRQVRQVVGWCHRLGIRTKGFFIVGHPGETLSTIDQTIQMAINLPLDDVVVTFNTPLPGTEQYRTADQYGSIDRRDWSEFSMWNPVFVPKGLTMNTLVEKHKEFYRRFYLRPRIIMRYFQSLLFSKAGARRALSIVRSLAFLLKNKTI